ncbi:UNVERIFIED_CONTAM: hypothetical protein H355_001648, partial [Colinus virginianus]
MRPLLLGADMALVSTTKFYDGHNITVGGAVVCRDASLCEQLAFYRNMLGNIMSPQVAFYTLLTVKTLALRMQRQCSNALRIARFLEGHPKVEHVIYPGLASFQQRQLAIKQHATDMHGSMIGFEVRGGNEAVKESEKRERKTEKIEVYVSECPDKDNEKREREKKEREMYVSARAEK